MKGSLKIKTTRQLMTERKLLKNQQAQVYVDSQCVRMMAPHTPFLSGTLRDAPYAGTHFGSGVIRQSTPYAAMQYYNTHFRHRVGGPLWFETMKAQGGILTILREARRITGARNG